MRGLSLVALLSALMIGPSSNAAPFARAQFGFVRGPSVFLASTDGTHQRIVLRGKGNTSYFEPAWSLGGRLAVTRDIYGQGGSAHAEDAVVVVRPGRSPRVVPGGHSGHDGSPSWAPDSKRIALIANRGPHGGELYAGRTDSQTKSVTHTQCCDVQDDEPAWSPDGKRIAFVVTKYWPLLDDFTAAQLFIVQPDGTGRAQLTKVEAHNPSWSPDSSQIAFDDGKHISVINADGTGLRRLTSNAEDTDPAWSPNGRQIAFVRGSSIWVIEMNAKHAHKLIQNASQPAWAP